jgi:hypothetical protein
MWHEIGLSPAVPFRKQIGRALVGALIVVTAFVSVGLTAPADGPFSIGIRPVFPGPDPAAVAASRARALGLDVDIKLGTIHLHIGWSIPLLPASTKTS